MLQDYSKKTVCVIDCGLFVEVAVLLSKYFGRVLYYSPWESSIPRSNTRLPGYGIPNVTRINEYWSIKEEVDLWVFPDLYFGQLQLELQSQGKRVWGSRLGEELELHRKESKEYLKKIGIPIGKYQVIKGLDMLREFLKKNDDQWVKVSTTRGDMETFHSIDYKNIEPRLDELEHTLGAKKSIMEFIVEEGIKDAIEIGFDGFTIDGNFPKKCMSGIEIKDCSYIGVFKDYKDMPKQIINVNNKLSDTLKKYGYKNWFCTEMRITKDGVGWVIDPLCRFGSPPGELVLLMYTNLPDIFWYGAEGKIIEPIPAGKFGAEILIQSAWVEHNWQAVDFPKEIRDNVKLRNFCMIDGKYYVIPLSGMSGIGAVVSIGNTMDEAIKKCKEYAKQIQGYGLEIHEDSLDDANDEIEKAKKFGVNLI